MFRVYINDVSDSMYMLVNSTEQFEHIIYIGLAHAPFGARYARYELRPKRVKRKVICCRFNAIGSKDIEILFLYILAPYKVR